MEEKTKPNQDYITAIDRFENARTESSHGPTIVLVNDITPSAVERQRQSIGVHYPDARYIPSFSCAPYSLVSAAYQLNLSLGDLRQFPPGSIFCITVDPHVNQNDEKGQNSQERRSIIVYEDGTILIGPNHSYVRVGEFHGRGSIVAAFEIDRERLSGLLYPNQEKKTPGIRTQHHVFDGLGCFGPTVALLARGHRPDEFADQYPVEEIQPLEIPTGTITEIEDGYGNIVVEYPDVHEVGTNIAITDPNSGDIIFIAQKRKAFEQSEIVSVDGSEPQITDSTQRALYLGIVQGNLSWFVKERKGRQLQIGDRVEVHVATDKEVEKWNAECRLLDVEKQIVEAIKGSVRYVRHLVVGLLAKKSK